MAGAAGAVGRFLLSARCHSWGWGGRGVERENAVLCCAYVKGKLVHQLGT